MKIVAEASSNSVAWFTLAGTLGGVIVTGIIALITAILNHRWQAESRKQELSAERFNQLRTERRQIYVSYFSAEARLMQMADGIKKQVQSGDLPPSPEYPRQLEEPIGALASTVYEINLIAGRDVREALAERQNFVAAFRQDAGKAEQTPDDFPARRSRTYISLAEAMRAELLDNSPVQSHKSRLKDPP